MIGLRAWMACTGGIAYGVCLAGLHWPTWTAVPAGILFGLLIPVRAA